MSTRLLAEAAIATTDGGSVRSIKDLLGADVANLLGYRFAIDADWTNAFTRALASGKPIEIPYNGGVPYVISNTVAWDLPANTDISGKKGRRGGRPTIQSTKIGRIFRILTSGVSISDIIIDGNKTAINALGTPGPAIDFQGAINGEVRNVKLLNPSREIRLFAGTTETTVADCEIVGSLLHSVQLDGATTCRNTVTRTLIDSGVGFGVILTNGAYKNEISFNRTYQNGIELVGVTYSSWGNRIIGNHAEGCGDNGISVTGHDNVVSDNQCWRNDHNGICIYGSGNAGGANICRNNGQRFLVDGSSWSGLHFNPAFGGAGYSNAFSGGVCSDDQAVPTQAYGVRFGSHDYVAWGAGQIVGAGTAYRYSGNNVYVSATAGTTGATAPTHTAGTVSDGAVSWTYLFSGKPLLGASNNFVTSVVAQGNRLGPSVDTSGNANTFLAGNGSALTAGPDSTPVGNLLGYGGDVYVRRGNATPYTGIYLNYHGPSVQGDQNWSPVQPRVAVAYTARLGGLTGLGAGLEGAQQFITDQNRLLIASGASLLGLVDALGRLEAPAIGVTAAGTTQADATQLALAHTRITTAAAGTGVVLPAMFAGAEMLLFNDGANAVLVYPSGTRVINSLAASAPYSLAAGSAVRVVGWDSGTYGVR